jgi:hypothetical protein
MLGGMDYTEKERRGIAEAVRRARVAQGLDKEPAARAAKVNSITWKRVEDAEAVRDASLGKILASLGLPNAEALVRDPWPAQPARAPDEPDYLQEVDFAARAIKLVGEELLAAIPEPFISEVAKALSELADEYARTLLAAVEENPMRRGRFSEPYTAAVVAARHFQAIHHAPMPTPALQAQRGEQGTATGASAHGAQRIWEAKSPDKEQP